MYWEGCYDCKRFPNIRFSAKTNNTILKDVTYHDIESFLEFIKLGNTKIQWFKDNIEFVSQVTNQDGWHGIMIHFPTVDESGFSLFLYKNSQLIDEMRAVPYDQLELKAKELTDRQN